MTPIKAHEIYHIFSPKELKLIAAIIFFFGLICLTIGVHISKEQIEYTSNTESSSTAVMGANPENIPTEDEINTNQEAIKEQAKKNISAQAKEEVQKTKLTLPRTVEFELPK